MTCLTSLMTTSLMMSPTLTSTLTSMTNWISPSVMRALGWTLLHFLWQGTALAAIAAAAMALSRRSSVRYAVGVGALVLMFFAPLVTLFFYSGHSGAADTVKSSPLAAAVGPTARDRAAAGGSIQVPRTVSSPDALPWLVEAWLLGVTLFSLRSVGGFFLLERKRRRQSSVVSDRVLEICYMLQDRLGLKRAIQYCECKWLQAPAVIGWFRPIVFLPVTALTGLTEEQLQSVIAHELAHIYRHDAFVNVFQVVVETLLFYHPAVWWLNKRIRDEREHCCDDIAVALCGNAVEYARALTLMEEWRSAPVLAMAANRGPLTERVFRVLGLKTSGRRSARPRADRQHPLSYRCACGRKRSAGNGASTARGGGIDSAICASDRDDHGLVAAVCASNHSDSGHEAFGGADAEQRPSEQQPAFECILLHRRDEIRRVSPI